MTQTGNTQRTKPPQNPLKACTKRVQRGQNPLKTATGSRAGDGLTHLAFDYVTKSKAKPVSDKPKRERKPKTEAPAGDVPGHAVAAAKKAGLTPAQIARKARPGETWDQAAARLAREPA